jgi:hypothetical protein
VNYKTIQTVLIANQPHLVTNQRELMRDVAAIRPKYLYFAEIITLRQALIKASAIK